MKSRKFLCGTLIITVFVCVLLVGSISQKSVYQVDFSADGTPISDSDKNDYESFETVVTVEGTTYQIQRFTITPKNVLSPLLLFGSATRRGNSDLSSGNRNAVETISDATYDWRVNLTSSYYNATQNA